MAKKLSQRQIINNLQYAVADYAGQVQALEQENVMLSEALTECVNEAKRVYVDNSKKLSAYEVRSIREEHARGLHTQTEIASIYAVNPATVSRIVRGIYHSDVR